MPPTSSPCCRIWSRSQGRDSAGLGQGLDALDRALSRATLAQTGRQQLRALDDVRARLNTERVGITAQLDHRDANMASAITNMSQATCLPSRFAAFGRNGSVSLMDYLK